MFNLTHYFNAFHFRCVFYCFMSNFSFRLLELFCTNTCDLLDGSDKKNKVLDVSS